MHDVVCGVRRLPRGSGAPSHRSQPFICHHPHHDGERAEALDALVLRLHEELREPDGLTDRVLTHLERHGLLPPVGESSR